MEVNEYVDVDVDVKGIGGDAAIAIATISSASSNTVITVANRENANCYVYESFRLTSIPVLITITLSTINILFFKLTSVDIDELSIYKTLQNDSTHMKIEKSLLNALIIICVICLLTFAIVFIVWIRCTAVFKGYVMLSSLTLYSVIGGSYYLQVITTLNIPYDAITYYFTLYNFTVVGLISIFYQHGIPKYVTQMYSVITSVLLVWQFSAMSEYLTWSLLLLVSIYDLWAVLSPIGPLRSLVQMIRSRKVSLAGLMYEATISTTSSSNSSTSSTNRLLNQYNGDISNSGNHVEDDLEMISLIKADAVASTTEATLATDSIVPVGKSKNRSRKEKKKEMKDVSIKLGLGDFVFYSILVSRATLSDGLIAYTSCTLSIIIGLLITLFLLTLYKKSLPALPISIFLGIITYLSSKFLLIPSLYYFNEHNVYI